MQLKLIKDFIDSNAPTGSRRQHCEQLNTALLQRMSELETLCTTAIEDILKEKEGIFSSLIYGSESRLVAKKTKIDLLMKNLHSIYVTRHSNLDGDTSYKLTKHLVDFEEKMLNMNVFGVGESAEKTHFIELSTKRRQDFNVLEEQRKSQAELAKSNVQADTEKWKAEESIRVSNELKLILQRLSKFAEKSDNYISLVTELEQLLGEIAAFNGSDRKPLIDKHVQLEKKAREAFQNELRQFHQNNASQVSAVSGGGLVTTGWRFLNTIDAFARWSVQIKYTLDNFDKAFFLEASDSSSIEKEFSDIDKLSGILRALSNSDNDYSIDTDVMLYKIAKKISTAYVQDDQMFLVGLISLQRIHPNVAYVLNDKFNVPYNLNQEIVTKDPAILDTILSKARTVCSESKAEFAIKINEALQDTSSFTTQNKLD